jgi:hypothetical protein
MTAREYTEDLYKSAMWHCLNSTGLFYGKEGALKLAKEYGYGLACFPEKEAKEELQSSYSRLCVRAYNLKPPIDNREWVCEIIKSWDKEHTFITTDGEIVTKKITYRWYKTK